MKIATNKFQVCRIDGKGTIFDVDGWTMNVGFPRILMNFVKYGQDNKATKTIRIYIEKSDADLLADILAGNKGEEIYKACKDGAQKAAAEGKEHFYPGYNRLPNMGTHAKNGKPCRFRSFYITKGKKTQYVIVGAEGPGKSPDGKLIVPDGRLDYIYVPATHDDLRKIGLGIKSLCDAYVIKQFCLYKPEPVESAA